MRCNFIGALAFLALAPTALAVQLTITPESSFYVPSSFDGVPELGDVGGRRFAVAALFSVAIAANLDAVMLGAGEQFDYDTDARLAYVIGETGILNVLRFPDMSSPELVFSMDVGNTGTDVEVCNGVVAVAIEGAPTKQDNGTVVFHQGWSAEPGRGGMPELYEVTTMALPDMIHFSKDCSVMVIANEGEAGITNGSFVNPPGGVTVLKWVDGDVSQPPTVQHLDFSAFSGEELYSADGTGVLWSYRPENSVAGEDSFAQDLEPEYVAITEDASMAYVILQENNAVAFVSLGETPKVEAIAPLGLKDWSSLTMDASNVDGKVNMASYPIWGAYQPDTIQTFSSGGKQYLVTANEGDSKEYLVDNPDETEFWIEEVRGADIANFGPDVSQEMRDMLADESQLGRLKFLSRHGLDENGMMAKFITMGGRSVTIFEMTDDFRAVKVWDSGDEIERKHAEMDPNGARGLFNPEQESGFIAAGFDQRSDDKGVETETVALGMCGGAHLLFVGNERSSALTIYDITDPAAPVMLEQVPLANPTGQGNTTWEALHAERALGVIDPESMKYVAMDDTNGHLMVAGAVSGTLSTLKISCEDGGSAPSQDSGAGLSALTAPISLLLPALLALMLVLNEPRF